MWHATYRHSFQDEWSSCWKMILCIAKAKVKVRVNHSILGKVAPSGGQTVTIPPPTLAGLPAHH